MRALVLGLDVLGGEIGDWFSLGLGRDFDLPLVFLGGDTERRICGSPCWGCSPDRGVLEASGGDMGGLARAGAICSFSCASHMRLSSWLLADAKSSSVI